MKRHLTDIEEYSLRDHFLIALPGTADPSFAHAVTYICDHSAEGAMGVVINHPMEDITLDKVFEQQKLERTGIAGDAPVLAGGPVSRERGFILHPPTAEKWQSTLQVSDEVCLTVSRDILEAMAAGKGPAKAQLILGYAGWEAGQLEDELAQNGWLTVPAQSSVIFDTPLEQRWTAAARQLGIDVNLISTRPGHA
jgi:putative transcriptional regulator